MFRPNEVKFYTDLMIIDAISLDNSHTMRKNASMTSDIIAKVSQYVSNNIDPNDKVGSLFNILAPGAIALSFRAMGLGWLGTIIGFAMRMFHIDVGGIVSSIWSALKSSLSSGDGVTSSQVESAVNSAVQQHAGSGEEIPKKSSDIMNEARMLKLALLDYEKYTFSLTKEAAPTRSMWSSRAGTSSVLGTLLGVIFKVALASAGLMVAGDVVNKFLGRPNALDNTIQHGLPVAQVSTSRSKQTKFPINPSYHEPPHSGTWAMPVLNEPSNIENMLLQFAKDVYSGLDGSESVITSSPTFQKIKSDINWYNHASAGDNVVIIPNKFTSKKDLVDYFIDEVAQNAK